MCGDTSVVCCCFLLLIGGRAFMQGSRSFATPSVVARRLLALAFTCKDMHSVVISHGFPAMATEVTEFVAKFLQCTSDREAEGVRNLRELLEFLNSITEERRQGIAALLSQAWNGVRLWMLLNDIHRYRDTVDLRYKRTFGGRPKGAYIE